MIESKRPYIAPETNVEEVLEQIEEEEQEEQEDKDIDIEEEIENNQPEKKDMKEVILDFLDGFCKGKNVFVVNMPRVTIRNNGHIIGCSKRLTADRERDVLFEFDKKEFTRHPGEMDSRFVMTIVNYLANLSYNNYVFINRRSCGFKEDKYGNVTLVLYVVAKRKYFFGRR